MPEGNPTELVKPLPGQSEADKRLLDQAVAKINGLHRLKTMELVTVMGEYIIDTFFGGDPENLYQAGDHVSWRALGRRKDLNVSHTQLWFSAQIVGQMRQLPASVAEVLSFSHHKVLVAVHDADAKAKLAERAASKGLTVKQLEAAVAKERAKDGRSRGGRPRIPPHLKALRRLPMLVEPLTTTPVSAEDVALLGRAGMRELKETLEVQIETLRAASQEIDTALKQYAKDVGE